MHTETQKQTSGIETDKRNKYRKACLRQDDVRRLSDVSSVQQIVVRISVLTVPHFQLRQEVL